jgi:hypothetical protein
LISNNSKLLILNLINYCLVKDTMNVEILKEDGARTQSPGSSGTQCANNESTSAQKAVIIGSPFVRTGSIRIENQALRIDYEAFHERHSVFIGMKDLQQLARDRFAPAAPVKEIRPGADGSEVCEKIGYAARTASGKVLKINTIHSGGDLTVPWTTFLQVINGKIKSAPISRIRIAEAPKTAPAPARGIYAGLERGF